MLNDRLTDRAFKDSAYLAMAEVSKAFANPKRLELLELLIQGPRSVDSLAGGSGQPIASASQHLQVLKRGGLVRTQRRGKWIVYSLVPGVDQAMVQIRALATSCSPTLRETRRSFFETHGASEDISPQTLQTELAQGRALLLDLRPAPEFEHAHIAGALSLPIDQLPHRLDELPRDRLLVATCRGPQCTFAPQAVELLRAEGFRAVRLEACIAEWRLAGGAIESGR